MKLLLVMGCQERQRYYYNKQLGIKREGSSDAQVEENDPWMGTGKDKEKRMDEGKGNAKGNRTEGDTGAR